MDRLPTNYTKVRGLEYIDNEDLLSIEQDSRFLDLDDCLIALFVDKRKLSDWELDVVTQVHKRGRQKGITQAGELLFRNMSAKTGTNACLEYLRQFSSDFTIDVTPMHSGSSSGFNFNVYANDEPVKKAS